MNILSGDTAGQLKLWKNGGGDGSVLKESWSHKVSDEPLTAISIGKDDGAVAVGTKNGSCLVY